MLNESALKHLSLGEERCLGDSLIEDLLFGDHVGDQNLTTMALLNVDKRTLQMPSKKSKACMTY